MNKKLSTLTAPALRAKHCVISLMIMLFALPTLASAASGDSIFVEIHSMDDWNRYAEMYGSDDYDRPYGTNSSNAIPYYLDVKLCCDLTFDIKSKTWEYFNGRFDGQGHTIYSNFKYDGRTSHYVFFEICGTIENLNIQSNIEYRYGSYAYTKNYPLAYESAMDITLKNCHCRAKFVEVSTYGVFGIQYAQIGGFMGQTYRYAYTYKKEGAQCKVKFQDCSFVGSFQKQNRNDQYWYTTAGFVGQQNTRSNITIDNCLSYITFQEGPKVEATGYFVGSAKTDGVTTTNSYCYSPSSIAKDVATSGATLVTASQLKSGEVAHKLAGGRTGADNPWRQTIGTDAVPETGITSPDSKEVFHANQVDRSTTDKWTTLFYPNNVTLPSGVKKYVVVGTKDGDADLSELAISNTAQVPLVLYSENGFSGLTLPAVYYNKTDQTATLRGAYETTTQSSGDYALDGANSKFVPATSSHNQWQCYLTGGTGDGYKLDTENSDIVVISSKEAWNNVKTLYNGKEITAYLDCDLTLTADDEAMESFRGTLDGQGHSIIYDFDATNTTLDKDKHYGLFYKATGTIRNLNITGSIKTKVENANTAVYPAPLAYMTNGTDGNADELNIDNCHSDLSYSASHSALYTGTGFLIAPTYATINFTDCSFTGTFASPTLRHAGGLVARQWQTTKINMTDCFSDVHIPSGTKIDTETSGLYSSETVGYFIGRSGGYTDPNLTNCYAHNSSTLTFGSTRTGETLVTDSQLTMGEVTYKLNAKRTGDEAAWLQTIDADTLPQLKTFSPESKEVLHAAASTRAASTDKWSTLYYPTDVTFSSTDLRIYDQFATTDNDTIYAYENISGTLPAHTPALLYCESGIPTISLPDTYYNKVEQEEDGLVGVLSDTAASALCTMTFDDGLPYFKAGAAQTLNAWQCYFTEAGLVIDDGVFITTKDEWNTFKTRYSGRTVNAHLICDLELTSSDASMASYKGTFNGAAATITLNNAPAPFASAEGIIKHLTIVGTPATDNSALVNTASGNLALQDCRCTAGALLGHTVSDAKPLKAAATNTISYDNCLVINGTDTLAYIGTNATARKVTAAQLKNGELTYKLNDGRTGYDIMWTQSIGIDDMPTLDVLSMDVYQATDTVKIGTTGWATHFYPIARVLPESVKAYTVNGVGKASEGSDYVVQLTELTGTIPAYAPVLLCTLGEGQTKPTEIAIEMPSLYYNTLTENEPVSDQAFQLVGVSEDTEAFDGSYVLQQLTDDNGQTKTAFYRVNTDEETPTVPAWQCMLVYNEHSETGDEGASNAKAIQLRFDDPTGIDGAINAIGGILSDGQIYDLQGRRVQSLQKGQIYIKNGQKFIIR